MSGSARRITRSLTGPVRDYFNEHFENVKREVRDSRAAPGTDEAAWQRLAELEGVLAEQGQHHARVLARLSDEVAALGARIDDLERVVRQLTEVVAPPRDT